METIRPLEKIESNLVETVGHLSRTIGERSVADPKKLDDAAGYIEDRLRDSGCTVKRQPFTYRNLTYSNIIAEVEGLHERRDGVLVIGAHYDTVAGTPGADDNASGVAGLLELARLTVSNPMERTVHFVAFSLEEFPAFRTKHMGSYFYASLLKDRATRVYGMISLEMLGYYCETKGCQLYPSTLFRLFYPARGNFISFVGNLSSRPFMHAVKESFLAASRLPVKSLSGISLIPGVDFSDHRNFWKFGFPAFMITDTAFYRNPNYHGPGDTAETLAYEKMAELVAGLYKALSKL
jgi:Zn-dependent M28 family amino/carboxypeptidase